MKQFLNEKLIIEISKKKQEPLWMLNFRLNAFKKFKKQKNPTFGVKLNINYKDLNYYHKVGDNVSNWNKVDKKIKKTFNELGVIKAENDYLCGVTNQFESEVIYHNQKNKDIIFCSTDDALKNHSSLFKKYFSKLVKVDENKFTALNGCLWSGGSFIYIPPNTKLDRPLQSYFRIESKSLGQFERTIIIVDENSELSYIEGCTAISHSASSLHAGVVEIYLAKNAKCRYTTIQNWSKDVYNLVTKRSILEENAQMEWIDGNIGSKVSMKYPSCILKGDNSYGNSISVAYAQEGQILDVGAKMIHLGNNTKSNILSKSIASANGQANYRGLVKISSKAKNAKAKVKCDTLLLDNNSQSNTYPTNIINNDSSTLEHEATISKVDQDKLFYLMSKGITESQATELLVMGFINDFKKELPMEYAVEINRLLKKI